MIWLRGLATVAVGLAVGAALGWLFGAYVAAWWLAARTASQLVDLTGIYRGSEYLMNLVTHAIVAFEAVFALGLWFAGSRPIVTRAGIVAWPLVGILAGEPFWGLAMGIFCVSAEKGVGSHFREAPWPAIPAKAVSTPAAGK